jgi:serine/threonine protein kinase
MDDQLRDKIRRETARRIDAMTAVPGAVLRYDRNGDGVLDDEEWEVLRATIESEVVRELTHDLSTHEDAPPLEDTDEWTPEQEFDPHVDLPVLEVIDERYEVLKELGRGTQGQTLLARKRDDESYVALKELSFTNLDSWKSLELFEREAKTLRQLDHPSIPKFVDSFHVEIAGAPPRFFIAQEFVSGDNLAVLLARGERWGATELARLSTDLLEVLRYLHEMSPPIVHRDIKPSNIIRRPDGSHALVDFGGVQLVMPDDVGGSTVVGTSGYMPAEQLTGRAVPASDLYGLGTTLVHLLTRVHPSDLPQERLKLVWKDRTSVAPAWSAFVDRLIAPVVEDRFPSAGDALGALPGDSAASTPRPSSALLTVPARQRGSLGPQFEERAPAGDVVLHRRPSSIIVEMKRRPLDWLTHSGSDWQTAVVLLATVAIAVAATVGGTTGVALIAGLSIALFAGEMSNRPQETVTVYDDGRFELERTEGKTNKTRTKLSGRLLDLTEQSGFLLITSDVELVKFGEECRPESRKWIAQRIHEFVET